MAIRYGRGDVKQTTTGFRGPLMVQSLTSAKSKFLSLSVALALIIPSSLCAATLQEKVRFAYNIGTQAGKQYCKNGAILKDSWEKGIYIAYIDANIPMTEISEMDFEDDRYSLPMIEGMISYTIDNCPERLKSWIMDIYREASKK